MKTIRKNQISGERLLRFSRLTLAGIFLLSGSIFLPQTSTAQLEGVSYTISPTLEYTFWDKKSGLDNGVMYGGKLGFAFGEYFEVRGSYMQSNQLRTNLSGLNLPGYVDSLAISRSVDLNRIGGEMRANFSQGTLLPFFTLGTGVQSIKMDGSSDEHQQIYLTAGAGVNLSLADRYTFSLEARNTAYRFKTASHFLTAEEKILYGVPEDGYSAYELKNWSIMGSLQFYLGGRKPGELSELDKAYFQTLTSGFGGLRGTAEPMVGMINFHSDLAYRNTNLVGINAGVDFTEHLGMRAFYWNALEDGGQTKLDKLAMYGAELRMRLNSSGTGVVPYIMLGGGSLNVQDNYAGRSILQADSTELVLSGSDKGFAMAGAGLSIPLSKNVNVFGSARSLIMSSNNINNLDEPEQINSNWMYSAGFKISLGRKAQDPNALVDYRMNNALMLQSEQDQRNLDQLELEYRQKMDALEVELNNALVNKDLEKAKEILAVKDATETQLENITEIQKENQVQNESAGPSSTSSVQMTPTELESLIEEILAGVSNNGSAVSPYVKEGLYTKEDVDQMMKMEDVLRRMSAIELSLQAMESRQSILEENVIDQVHLEFEEFSTVLFETLDEMSSKMDSTQTEVDVLSDRLNGVETNTTKSDSLDQSGMNPVINNAVDTVKVAKAPQVIYTNHLRNKPDSTSFLNNIHYTGMSPFLGINVGGTTSANVGLRWFYGLGKKNILEFMPEAYIGKGTTTTFGLTANLVAPINLSTSSLKPYLGLGGGIMKIEQDGKDELIAGYNIIIGTYLNLWGGQVYTDFTARNLFKNNQLIIGYRLPF